MLFHLQLAQIFVVEWRKNMWNPQAEIYVEKG